MRRISTSFALIVLLFIGNLSFSQSSLDSWKEGYLDIHHINTGRGDAAFFIFPDGTTMIFDIGSIEGDWADLPKEPYEMQITPIYPNDSLRPGQWIANYIKQVFPEDREMKIDYALISHFHGDHFGTIHDASPKSKKGDYQLSGITDLYESIPMDKIIDRDFPNYNFPIESYEGLDDNSRKTFENYKRFLEDRILKDGLSIEALRVGSDTQIAAKNRIPDFKVLGIKRNGTILDVNTGIGKEFITKQEMVDSLGKFNENPLSIAIKLSYGDFDYFTGGDNTGVRTRLRTNGMEDWWDVETPIAKAVGEVEVSTMNHHGVRDAMNPYFIHTLQPQVFVQQSHTSDHPGQEAFYRMLALNPQPDFFATNIHTETKATYGWWFTDAYESMHGHILIRVMNGGKEYYVIVLDHLSPELKVEKVFGPYKSKP